MENSFLNYESVVFDAKPDAIPYNYRISYRIAQLCLIMRICGRNGSCSLIKIHMVAFALISNANMQELLSFSDGTSDTLVVRFDPSVNRALTYAKAYGLVSQHSATYKLTELGKEYADQIMSAGDLFLMEINNLNSLSKKLTEGRINQLIDKWRTNNVENQST